MRLLCVASFHYATINLSDVGHCYSADASADNYFAVLIFAIEGSGDVPKAVSQICTEWLLRLDPFLTIDFRQRFFGYPRLGSQLAINRHFTHRPGFPRSRLSKRVMCFRQLKVIGVTSGNVPKSCMTTASETAPPQPNSRPVTRLALTRETARRTKHGNNNLALVQF
jgi:hypothetical protein